MSGPEPPTSSNCVVMLESMRRTSEREEIVPVVAHQNPSGPRSFPAVLPPTASSQAPMATAALPSGRRPVLAGTVASEQTTADQEDCHCRHYAPELCREEGARGCGHGRPGSVAPQRGGVIEGGGWRRGGGGGAVPTKVGERRVSGVMRGG
jgi:hypothetical protein